MWAIKDWDKHYERAESRKLSKLTWVPIQNKHDGKSFRRLMRLSDGLAIFGAFILLVELASKSPRPSRGLLADADGPLTLPDISDKTGMSQEIIGRSLEVLSSKEIAWIEAKNVPSSPDNLPKPPDDLGFPPGHIEGNGMVEKGRVADNKQQPKPLEVAALPADAAAETGWPLFAAEVRERFPTAGDSLINKIAESAIAEFPPVTDENLVCAVRAATVAKQQSAALYLTTIPEVIRSWKP